MKKITRTKKKILEALSDKEKVYTITPKEFKKNSKEALKKCEKELVKIIFKEREIQEREKQIINEINYWKNLK